MSNEWFWGDVNCVLISTDIFDMFTMMKKLQFEILFFKTL